MSPSSSDFASLQTKGEETEKRDLVSLILSCGALSLWFGSLWTTRVWWVPPQLALGLFEMLPPLFWVASLMAIVSTVVNIHSSRKPLFFFQLLSLSTILVGTPVLVETNARHIDSWAHLGATLQLIASGLPNPSSASPSWLDATLQVPGSFLFQETAIAVAKLPVLTYLRLFPLFSSVIFLLGYFAWLSPEAMPVRKLASVLVLLSNVWLHFYFGTQSYGLMLLPIAVMAFRKIRNGTSSWTLAVVLVWAGLSISHPTTAGTLLIILATEGLVRKAIEKKDPGFGSLLMVALIFVSATFYNGPAVVQENIIGMKDFIFSGVAIEQGKALLSGPSKLLSNPIFFVGSALASLIRIGTIVVGITAAWSWIILALRRHVSGLSQALSWVLVCSLLVLASLATGQEIVLAGYAAARSLGLMFFIVPLLLARLGVGVNGTSLMARIGGKIPMILCATAFLAMYYVENARIISASDLANVSFLFAHSTGKIFAGSNFSPFLTLRPHLDFHRVDLADPKQLFAQVVRGSVIVSDSYSNSIPFSSNLIKFWAAYANGPESNRIYDSSWFADGVVSAIEG